MATTPQLISLLVSETGIFIQVSMHKGTFSEKVSTCWEEMVQTIIANVGCCLRGLNPTLSACETEAIPEQQVITVKVFQLAEPNCEIFHTDF